MDTLIYVQRSSTAVVELASQIVNIGVVYVLMSILDSIGFHRLMLVNVHLEPVLVVVRLVPVLVVLLELVVVVAVVMEAVMVDQLVDQMMMVIRGRVD